MVKMVIFRHGETDANKSGVCQADDDNFGLNNKGIAQAYNLRSKLKKENIDIILSSPLKRAIQTAKIVASANNMDVISYVDLREMNTGNADGMTYDEFYNKYITIFGPIKDANHKDFMTTCVPNGESRSDILKRWKNVVDHIKLELNSYKTIGVATHYGVIKALLFHYTGEDKDEIENCEYFIINI